MVVSDVDLGGKLMVHNPNTQRKSRMKLRRQAIDHLGGSCVSCGENDYVVLEFDHIDAIKWRSNNLVKINGQQNTNQINRMIKAGDDPNKLFQLLCASCHKRKTHDNKDFLAERETECQTQSQSN